MSQSLSQPARTHETGQPYLTLRQNRLSSGIEMVLPVGEIDLCTAPALDRALGDLDRRGVSYVVVDLSKVSFLAVVGVHVLVDATMRATAAGRRVALVVSTTSVRRVLDLMRLTGDLEIYGSTSQALDAIAFESV